VQIRGDAQSDFASVGKVLNAVRQAGIAKVAFITEPH
jgi:biopolymer transport protein ExbD